MKAMLRAVMPMQEIKFVGAIFYQCEGCGLMDCELDTPVLVARGDRSN
jgi:hypothetical protein